MLIGQVTPDKEAVLPIEVLGPTGASTSVDAAIDTGFNGYLTLPASQVTELGLSFAGTTRAILGDGTGVVLNLYLAAVHWHDGPRDALVLEAAGGVLLGMAMLAGNRVTLEVVDKGTVIVEPL